MGVVTVCSTVCASAPIKLLVTCTVGGVISGYWLTGRLNNESKPTNTKTIEMTMAVTGRLIKVSAIMLLSDYDDFLFDESLTWRPTESCPDTGAATLTFDPSLNFC